MNGEEIIKGAESRWTKVLMLPSDVFLIVRSYLFLFPSLENSNSETHLNPILSVTFLGVTIPLSSSRCYQEKFIHNLIFGGE